MSYYPPITSIQEYNQWATGCACTCALPGCAEPVIESKSKAIPACFWTNIVDGCVKKYKVRTITQSLDTFQSGTSNGFTIWSILNDWSQTQTSTYTQGEQCSIDVQCVASGIREERRFFARLNAQQVVVAVFPELEILETLDLWDGMPDPTWSPSSGQTEADRPILPNCSPIWTTVRKTYTATRDTTPPFAINGSVLASTTTTYSKQNFSTIGPFEYSNEVNCDDLRAEIEEPSFDDVPESSDLPLAIFNCSSCGFDSGLGQYSRYRWTVPPEHEGSYYRIDWDEVFLPKAFLDWQSNPVGAPPVLPTLTPKSWTWTGTALGPCCGEETDTYEDRLNDPSRKSPWGNMAPPETAGRKEIANVRVLCYRSPFGALPWLSENFATVDLEDLNANGIPDADE